MTLYDWYASQQTKTYTLLYCIVMVLVSAYKNISEMHLGIVCCLNKYIPRILNMEHSFKKTLGTLKPATHLEYSSE